jgi:DNA mismatch repair ATPase MutS
MTRLQDALAASEAIAVARMASFPAQILARAQARLALLEGARRPIRGF